MVLPGSSSSQLYRRRHPTPTRHETRKNEKPVTYGRRYKQGHYRGNVTQHFYYVWKRSLEHATL
jgi:hypothetical protein